MLRVICLGVCRVAILPRFECRCSQLQPKTNHQPNDKGLKICPCGGINYDINDQWLLENRLGYQDREVSVNMPSVPFGVTSLTLFTKLFLDPVCITIQKRSTGCSVSIYRRIIWMQRQTMETRNMNERLWLF